MDKKIQIYKDGESEPFSSTIIFSTIPLVGDIVELSPTYQYQVTKKINLLYETEDGCIAKIWVRSIDAN